MADPDRSDLNRATALAVSAAAFVAIVAGLVGLALNVQDTYRLAAIAGSVLGLSAASWLHWRLRGSAPIRWMIAAGVGLGIGILLPDPQYGRPGLIVSASAGVGILLEAWQRPMDTLIALGGLGTALIGHLALLWASTIPHEDGAGQVVKTIVFFGAAGSLMVGTSSAAVWAKATLKQISSALPRSLAWSGMVLSLVCAGWIGFQGELAPPYVTWLWGLGVVQHLGALIFLIGFGLSRSQD